MRPQFFVALPSEVRGFRRRASADKNTRSPAKPNAKVPHASAVEMFDAVGCMATANNTERGAVNGALVGGILGGVIGHNKGRKTAEGAAIGALGGALLGGAVGNAQDKKSGNK